MYIKISLLHLSTCYVLAHVTVQLSASLGAYKTPAALHIPLWNMTLCHSVMGYRRFERSLRNVRNRRHTPDERNPQLHHCGNFKTRIESHSTAAFCTDIHLLRLQLRRVQSTAVYSFLFISCLISYSQGTTPSDTVSPTRFKSFVRVCMFDGKTTLHLYGTPQPITVLTRLHYWTLSRAR